MPTNTLLLQTQGPVTYLSKKWSGLVYVAYLSKKYTFLLQYVIEIGRKGQFL